MPYKSDAQRRWAHTDKGTKALGGPAKVAEWDRASKGIKLPEKLALGGQVMNKFSSRPRPAEYLRGGPVQAEKRSWAKSSRLNDADGDADGTDMMKTADTFRTDSGPGANKTYGKSGGDLGSQGMHGPNCGCATCRQRWGS